MNPFIAYRLRTVLLSWIESAEVIHWLWTLVIGLSAILMVVLVAMLFRVHQFLSWQHEKLLDFAAFRYFS